MGRFGRRALTPRVKAEVICAAHGNGNAATALGVHLDDR
jgi:hypothetical protein